MPPRYGTMNIDLWAKSAPVINGYKTEAWTLKGAKILNINHEIEDGTADALIPPAGHPSIPQYASFNVMSVPDSPVGPYSIAEIRVCGRTGVRPRGFPVRSFVDSEAARRELAGRWGYPVAAGTVTLSLRHDRVEAKVIADGKTVLHCEQLDREMISGGDIQYIASMHLSRNRDDNAVVLVQVDPEYVFSKGERGRPRIISFDPVAWRSGDYIRLTNPISASFATCDVTLPKLRYITDPLKPAFQGTTKLAA